MSKIIFSEDFQNICRPLFGISKDQAAATIKSYDKVERLSYVERAKALLFLKYFGELGESYAVMVVAIERHDALEIFYAVKIYSSYLLNIFQRTPSQILESFMFAFGYFKEFTPGDRDEARRNLAFIIDPDLYIPWLKNKGGSSYEAEAKRLHEYSFKCIRPFVNNKEFRDKVFTTIHEFCFYCRQNPEALSLLTEQQIRDLFLVVVKCVFSQASGETFHYDGKLDFIITNPENKYEIVTGELKWWVGESSLLEVYNQAVRKHATGQEMEIYILILSRNKDSNAVFEKVKLLIASQNETISGLYSNRTPDGSKELFGEFLTLIRGNEIPLCVGIGNFYHQKQ